MDLGYEIAIAAGGCIGFGFWIALCLAGACDHFISWSYTYRHRSRTKYELSVLCSAFGITAYGLAVIATTAGAACGFLWFCRLCHSAFYG